MGSDVMDLPHIYSPLFGSNNQQCVCGRYEGHALHQPGVQEKASYSGPLQTEKGS